MYTLHATFSDTLHAIVLTSQYDNVIRLIFTSRIYSEYLHLNCYQNSLSLLSKSTC